MDAFELALETLNTEAGAKLFNARIHLCTTEVGRDNDAFNDAVQILFWAEYRVKSNIS